jgi:hypothetical protein
MIATCTVCQHDLEIEASLAGRDVQCPTCNATVRTPARPGASGSTPPTTVETQILAAIDAKLARIEGRLPQPSLGLRPAAGILLVLTALFAGFASVGYESGVMFLLSVLIGAKGVDLITS